MLSLAAGGHGTFTAFVVGHDPRCTHFALTVGWQSSDAAVARVEADTGNTTTVLGVGEGTASVIARVIADPTEAAAGLVTVSAGK